MTSPNAFPVFSAHERRKYAQVALGCCLDLKYYLGLQEKLAYAEQFEQERSQDISNECPDLKVKLNNDTVNQLSVLPEITTPNITKAEAVYATASICQKLNELIGTNDQQVISGILKMNSRLQKMSNSQVTSALQCFGSQFTYVKSSQLSAKARLSKARRGRIHVQPEASKRRKENNCKTKQALPKGKTASFSYVLPEKSNYSRKRRHCFSENVNAIVAVSKKSGGSMSSRTMPVRKPKVKKESY